MLGKFNFIFQCSHTSFSTSDTKYHFFLILLVSWEYFGDMVILISFTNIISHNTSECVIPCHRSSLRRD
jgi:hypothetical protein